MVFDVIDTSEWPIVHIHVVNPPDTNDQIDVFQAKFLALLQLAHTGAEGIAAEKICIVFNLEGLAASTLEQKIRAASFIKDVREFVNTSIYCTALIIQNETVRIILEFISSIQPLQSLNKVFATTEEGLAWSRRNRLLQQQGKPPVYE